MNYILGIKKGMTRVYKDLKAVPVTVLDTEGCVVALQTEEGVELGQGKMRNPNKAMLGRYKELGYVPQNRVWVGGKFEGLKVGDKVDPSSFELDSMAAVTGVSKGKGFAGVVKRWGFKGGPKTHGQSDRHRAPGSIGAGTDPGRVLKGKKMAGRMGGDKVTIANKRIVGVKDSFLLVSGGVPGKRGSLVIVRVDNVPKNGSEKAN